MVGTDGWGLYIHQPLGAFDFTGDTAKFTPPAGPNAIDLFVVSSKDPAVIMRDYAAHHGTAGNAGAVDARLSPVASHASPAPTK
jgi:hypothetical protein